MDFKISKKEKQILLVLGLVSFLVCIPIWCFDYFLTQDGTAHIYSSHIIKELLMGNTLYQDAFAFNSLSIPNATGHYFMAVLLLFLSPTIITKIFVTITLLGLAFSIAWFRYMTSGVNGIKTSFLFGLSISFNWLWLSGFYNFLIGIIFLIITIGLFFKWKNNLDSKKVLLLSFLILLVYLSHLISFLILFGSILAIICSVSKENLKKTVIFTFLAFLPPNSLLFTYKSISQNEGAGFKPVWRHLDNPYSILDWINQIRFADPFIIISRKTFPFIESYSIYFFVFTPAILILLTTFILLFATVYKNNLRLLLNKTNAPFIFLFCFSIIFAMFAPDDFGESNGTILRERVFLCGFIFLVPLFNLESKSNLKRIAQIFLILVISFQTFAIFEYAYKSNQQAIDFFQINKLIKNSESYATIVFLEKSEKRFHSDPIPQINNINGIYKNILIWDNYEMGHYLFPIVAKSFERRKLILKFTQNNVIDPKLEKEILFEKVSKINSVLQDGKHGIDKIIVWGNNKELESKLVFISNTELIYSDKNLRIYSFIK